ncbi:MULTISPECIES: Fe(3+) ABC transporter substrate-binding protein [Planktothrix]|uniref:Fe(3+) ABC transporter substrate-binding protein n=1 Tax=Planktothrix TaxID=54304 RepID=UPI000420D981|nr:MULTISPECIES: Fe(3+) ABC transporter substrate-binding protein [Planktothrix]CAD5918190.1 Iron deficiency-induced protein A [Planktothrix rubescens]CAH2572953.1 Iron deficiency-induced protein A [Planktothrix rubescens]
MNKITRRGFFTLGTALAVVAAVGLGPMERSQANPQVLNIYSARHYDTDNQIYESFTKKTGIKVNLVEGKAEEMVERIKSEGANSPADILITVDAGNLWRAQQQGIFQPISSATLNQVIPANLREPNGNWFGFSKRARVIVYNKNKVNPAQLSTYEDLANPKWKGKIVARSSNNIYNQSLVASMIGESGTATTETWVKGFVANFARPPEGNDVSQIKAVAAGVGQLTLANTYYLGRLVASPKPEDKAIASKVGLFFPNQRAQGTHTNISGAGVIKTAPNKAGAIQFLEHLASPEAQKIFAQSAFEYPVVAGVAVSPVLSSFGTFKSNPINVAAYGKFNSQAIQIMDRAGWK